MIDGNPIIDDLYAVMDAKIAKRSASKVIKAINKGTLANVDLKNKAITDDLALDVMDAVVAQAQVLAEMSALEDDVTTTALKVVKKKMMAVRSIDLTGNAAITHRTAEALIDALLRCCHPTTKELIASPVVSLTFGLVHDAETCPLPAHLLAEAAQLSATRKRKYLSRGDPNAGHQNHV